MNTRQIMLSAAAVLSVGALWGAGAMTSDAKEMIRKSDLSRQETVFRGDLLVREGHKLFLEKNYFGARDKYMEAIKLFQRYPSRFFQDKVDFCKVAEGLGCAAIKVTTKEEVGPAIEKAISLKAPVLIECVIPEDDKVFPMVPAGAPLTDVFDGDDLRKQQEK